MGKFPVTLYLHIADGSDRLEVSIEVRECRFPVIHFTELLFVAIILRTNNRHRVIDWLRLQREL